MVDGLLIVATGTARDRKGMPSKIQHERGALVSILWHRDVRLLALAALTAMALARHFHERMSERTQVMAAVTGELAAVRASNRGSGAGSSPAPAEKASFEAITAFAQQRAAAANVTVDRVQWQRGGAGSASAGGTDVEFAATGAYADMLQWARDLQVRYPYLVLKTLDLRLSTGPGPDPGQVEARLSFRMLNVRLPRNWAGSRSDPGGLK